MSYTLNRTGAQIDAIFNKVDTLFFATYGTTTYAEITTAISGGKRVFLFKGAQLYAYKGVDAVNSAYVFGQLQGTIDQPAAGFAYCTTGSSWGTEDVPLATLQQYYESLMEDEVSAPIASFPDGANNVPVRQLIAQINPTQSGSGDPAPDNVRPITGYTGANVVVGSRNLICKETFTRALLDQSTGEAVSANQWITTDYIKVEGLQSYTLSGWVKGSKDCFCVRFCRYDANKKFISCTGNTNVASGNWHHAYSLVSNCVYVRITYGFNSETTTVEDFFANCDVQFEKGSTATALDTYAKLYSVSWNTEAGTVYGGYLIVNSDGSKKLVKTYESIDLGSFTWTPNAAGSCTRFGTSGTNVKPAPNNNTIANISCSMYKPDAFSVAYAGSTDNVVAISNTGSINVTTSQYSSAADFKTAVTGQTLVYELATPVEYDLADVQQIKTLLGDNNIFTDTNGDVDVIYRANTALYIKKELEA